MLPKKYKDTTTVKIYEGFHRKKLKPHKNGKLS